MFRLFSPNVSLFANIAPSTPPYPLLFIRSLPLWIFEGTDKPDPHISRQKLDWDLVDQLAGTSIKGNWYPRHCVVNYLRRSKFVHMIPLFQHRTGILYTNDQDEVQTMCK